RAELLDPVRPGTPGAARRRVRSGSDCVLGELFRLCAPLVRHRPADTALPTRRTGAVAGSLLLPCARVLPGTPVDFAAVDRAEVRARDLIQGGVVFLLEPGELDLCLRHRRLRRAQPLRAGADDAVPDHRVLRAERLLPRLPDGGGGAVVERLQPVDL